MKSDIQLEMLEARSCSDVSSCGTKSERDQKIRASGFTSLFRYMERSDLPVLTLASVVISLSTAAVPLQSYIYGKIFEKLSDFYVYGVEYSTFIAQIRYLAGLIMIVGLIQAIFRWVSIYAWLIFGERQANRIRTKLYYQLVQFTNMEWYDGKSQLMGEITQVNRSIEELREGASGHLGLLVETLSTCVGLFVMAMVQSWALTLVILASVPVIAIFGWIFGSLTRRAADAENNYSSICSKILDWNLVNNKAIKMFNARYLEISKFNRNVDQSAKAFFRESNAISANGGILKTLSFMMFVQGFWFGNYLMSRGHLSINQVFTCFSSCLALGTKMSSISAIFAILNKAYAAVEKIATLMQPAPHSSARIKELSQKFKVPVMNGGIYPVSACMGSIRFKDVNFTYPARPSIQVLSNFDLEIRPSIMNFIVGKSGSGKSTIAQLILQFYKPADNSGRIEIDGFNIETLSNKWLAKNITYLQQTPAIFKDTLMENITIGCGETYGSNMAKVEEACEFALLHDVLSDLKDGLSTVIAPEKLSGGQKQRIAMARAFFRNTEVLILDEALSELDLRHRKALLSSIRDWRKGKTTIVITHDISSLEGNDYVITLDGGRVTCEHLNEETNENINEKGASIYEPELSELSEKIPNYISNPAVSKDLEKESNEKDLEDLKSAYFILKYTKQFIPKKLLLSFAVLISIFGGVLNPVFSYCFSKLMSNMVLVSLGQDVMSQLKTWSCIVIGIAIASGCCQYISQFTLLCISEKWIVNIRKEIFAKLVEKDVSYFELGTTDPAALTTLIMNDTRDLRNLVSEAITLAANLVIMSLVGVVWSIVIGWKLALVGIAFVPLIIIVTGLYSSILQVIEHKYKNSVCETESHLHDSVSNIKSIISLDLREVFIDKFIIKINTLKHNGTVRAILGGFGESLSGLCISVATGTILLYAMELTGKGEYTQERSIQVITLLTFTMAMVSSLVGQIPDISRGRRAGTYIIKLLELEESETETRGSIRPYTNLLRSKLPVISFDNVSFSYPNRPASRVLKGLQLRIQEGESVAITGESGSGKSTIALLLERFHITREGTISIKDTSINELDVEWLRSIIGYVPQISSFFEGSIYENLSYGLNQNSLTVGEIESALKVVNMYDFISSLELGLSSPMGEGSNSKFSGGQLQRLSIARALLRKPKILILDECTSALDPDNSKIICNLVSQSFYRKRDVTILAITHSKEMMRSCDRVCVLKKGVKVEDGEYNQLVKEKGELFRILNR
ncbi:alpha-factor-transporting ATPase [[Candida] railenensis]|uniref:Alpha-factor-transporting ATPase n=1 Tax=[Candida] railenensis TaxID=45579 RepID=A0A9P0VY89_9ASCO|nr:alpha-factor-transporting ATPase [[Candida] railenensis]